MSNIPRPPAQGNTLSIAEIAETLGNVKPKPNGGFKCNCPLHEADGGQHTPSLDIDPKNGKLLFYCRAGCTQPQVIAELKRRGLWSTANGRAPKQARVKRTIVKTYDYRDEQGVLLHQTVRFEPKHFSQRRPCPLCQGVDRGKCGNQECKRGWIWNLHNTRRVLYNLKAIIDTSVPDEAGGSPRGIVIGEGEKDADTGIWMGLLATTNAEGADKWQKDYNQYFAGRVVGILEDNDPAGRRRTLIIGRNLTGIAKAIKVLRLPDLPDKGDLTDWTNARRAEGLDKESILNRLLELFETAPEWSEPQAASNSAPPPNGDPMLLSPNWSEDLIALRFVRQTGIDFRYIDTRGAWYHWIGTRWNRDKTQCAYDAIRAHCREVAREAFSNLDGDAGPKVAKPIASNHMVGAVAKMVSADRKIAAELAQFDASPWLLNTPLGPVDLKSGELLPCRREDYLSLSTSVAPAEDENCPQWIAFLARMLDNDVELFNFIRRAFGYTITGSSRAQVLFMLLGAGRNGKGVALRTMRNILGSYGTGAQFNTFTATKGERHPTELARLYRRRMVITTETRQRTVDDGLVKQLTGEDPITARFMRQDLFEYLPEFALWIAGNKPLIVDTKDPAIKRRVLIIPCRVVIPANQVDTQLEQKLKDEWPGILRWCINGCLEWQSQGLKPPLTVLRVDDDLQNFDRVWRWLNECTERDEQAPWLGSAALDGSYQLWAQRHQEPALAPKIITPILVRLGRIQHRDTRTGLHGWLGFKLKPPQSNAEQKPADNEEDEGV